jgi:hypothetical protein
MSEVAGDDNHGDGGEGNDDIWGLYGGENQEYDFQDCNKMQFGG